MDNVLWWYSTCYKPAIRSLFEHDDPFLALKYFAPPPHIAGGLPYDKKWSSERTVVNSMSAVNEFTFYSSQQQTYETCLAYGGGDRRENQAPSRSCCEGMWLRGIDFRDPQIGNSCYTMELKFTLEQAMKAQREEV
jgi:hypothetical protein